MKTLWSKDATSTTTAIAEPAWQLNSTVIQKADFGHLTRDVTFSIHGITESEALKNGRRHLLDTFPGCSIVRLFAQKQRKA